MLALTTEAQEAIEGLLSASSTPPSAGVRIAPPADAGAPGSGELQITVAKVPAEADQVIDAHGARVFVDEAAVEFLDDKILDANISGNEIRFAIAEQSE
jgi:iron-sulfur cluster assembly protein